MKLRNFDPCRNDLQAAINIKENDPELHYQLGRSYLYESVYDQAIKHFNKAVSIKSDFKDAIAERGIAYVYTEEISKACDDFTTALKLGEKSKAVTSLYQQHCEK